jgi:drug/metabolite transporter (DMT)-like permease
MMNAEGLAVVYGLASATVWGAGDFSGGVATKRNNVYSVIIVSQLIGVALLVILAFLFAETIPSPDHLIFGGIAGISGAIGLVALYSGLAGGRMGFVAPVAAVVTAVFPVIVGIFNEGLPAASQILGFGIAVTAVWFLSGTGSGKAIQMRELGLPVVAGLGFGLFFICIDRVSSSAILWPLIAARIASIGLLSTFVAVRWKGQIPARSQFLIIALAGIFDTGGNAFFALATRVGRLDISAVLSSLYPAATVLLAYFILKERLVQQQWVGIISALVALILIAL